MLEGATAARPAMSSHFGSNWMTMAVTRASSKLTMKSAIWPAAFPSASRSGA
jgi:hypothetical protein